MMIPARNFSYQAGVDASNHPRYPEELFSYLAGLSTTTHRAYVYEIGNNQAATYLASRFDEVISADMNQVKKPNAPSKNNLSYICSTAAKIPLVEKTVDLLTVSQAWHWIEAKQLEQEAYRVLRPGGLLAVWGFNLPRIDEPISKLIHHYYNHELKDHWPDERKNHEQAYADFPTRLALLPTPAFAMHQPLTTSQLLNYILRWSATQELIAAGKKAVYDKLYQEVFKLLGSADKLLNISWPLTLKVARKKQGC